MPDRTMTPWPEPIVAEYSPALDRPDFALFDKDRTYRYLLTRRWVEAPLMTWIMLNPSTADALTDDPTITRCKKFARREGCGGIRVVNLFALRSTDPRTLREHKDPVGPSNDHFISDAAQNGLVVAAWGAHGAAVERGREVGRSLLAAGVSLSCLGVTKDGHPKHPLYVRADAPLVPWEPQP